MAKTLIVLNPHAGSGRAGRLWREIEPLLWQQLGELVVAVTQRPDEVAQHIDKAYAVGITRIISIGGDGTNHALINALADFNAQHPQSNPLVYGMFPIGTGRDWARGQGMPVNSLTAAAEWIARAQPTPTDIGQLTYERGREYFLNIASAGIGGEVMERLNRMPSRRPWSYLTTTIATLIQHEPQPMEITLDGQPWYEGTAYVVAIANGTTFGHGMKIAPDAKPRDGWFDVVLVRGVSRLRILAALQQVYTGSHLSHPAVRAGRAKEIHIRNPQGALGLELDGEPISASDLTVRVQPGLLNLLA